MNIDLVAEAGPNFMKISPLYHAPVESGFARPRLVYKRQHYDGEMSDNFFSDLRMPPPYFQLGCGGGSRAEQTGRVMIEYEKLLQQSPPDRVVVVGDVNSTLACPLAAKKLCLPVAHLEAGLRSGDRTMPEEVSRLAADAIADLLWSPSSDADANLLNEGANPSRIERVGNIMIDSYEMMRPAIEANTICTKLRLAHRRYAVLTLHRPVNVGDSAALARIVEAIEEIALRIPLVFPLHPRPAAASKPSD